MSGAVIVVDDAIPSPSDTVMKVFGISESNKEKGSADAAKLQSFNEDKKPFLNVKMLTVPRYCIMNHVKTLQLPYRTGNEITKKLLLNIGISLFRQRAKIHQLKVLLSKGKRF